MLIAFICQGLAVQAQSAKKLERWFQEAVTFYQTDQISETIDLCSRILEADPAYIDARLMLVDVYKDMDSTRLEIYHLEEAKKISTQTLILYRLADANYAEGNYSDGLKNFLEYLEKGKLSEKRKKEVERKIENCRFALEAMKNPVEFEPVRLSEKINSNYSEYWPSLTIDQKTMVFTRLMVTPGQRPHEDFFISEFDSTGWGLAQPILDINTMQNEGAQTLSADGKLLFFTACNRPGGKGSCDIFYSIYKNGQWSLPQNAGSEINTADWEAQPSLAADNRYLYFSSDRAGGKGKKDIWRARFYGLDEAGKTVFNKPENLGEKINTEGDEISPFIHPNTTSFYFASDFHVGMGRLDLFHAEMNFDEEFSSPMNLGYPINTHEDEQGLHISASGESALFASKRKKGSGLDIYSFVIDERLRPNPVSYVKAKVRDAETQKPLGAMVELTKISSKGSEKRLEKADENGEVLVSLPVGNNYAFTVSETGYLFYSQSFDLNTEESQNNPWNIDIDLIPVRIGAEMNLYNIYFETDSFKILEGSEPELLKLTMFLENNSGLKVEIQGHTDSSGKKEKNQLLSEKRAGSVSEFLIQQGIEADRLQHKGYGDKHPVATNETKEGKRLNRRTTIKIVGD